MPEWASVKRATALSNKRSRHCICIDIGEDSFHLAGLGRRGAFVPRQMWSRGQIGVRLAAIPSA
jgi:hypothetical protein